MKTRTEPHRPVQPMSKEHECVPCEIPSFCRNNYFTGKLMTARDFSQEQGYMIDKLRLHYLALHGWGVVCGVKVKPHPYCPELRLVVEPGFAIDSCGREIRIVKEVEIELPRPTTVTPLPKETCSPEPPAQRYPSQQTHQNNQEQHQYGPEQQDYPKQPEPPEVCEPITPLYVCLRYKECETEFMPAPFDECACTRDGQKPNRICESYELTIETEEPEWVKRRKEDCGVGDCRDLYTGMLEKCPDAAEVDCIPLAFIQNYTPGQKVTQEMIDNWLYRPLLPSTNLLDQLIRCILDKVPTRSLTRIVDLGWTHGGEYHCHDFVRQFIGTPQAPRGFEVVFDGKVRTEGLTSRTFQAVAVRYTEQASGAGLPEVVPARVRWNEDQSRIYLDIDPVYVERRLDRTRFDLYLKLRCDLILDDRGYPVDGEFLARVDSDGNYVAAPPTGDGIPGGLFESWIRVRP